MKFEIISKIEEIEIIARGTGVDIRHRLNAEYGRHNWRKMKGIAVIEYVNGQVWLAEVHWYEATGIGRKKEKDKRKLRRLA
jgi:hypothetical protein